MIPPVRREIRLLSLLPFLLFPFLLFLSWIFGGCSSPPSEDGFAKAEQAPQLTHKVTQKGELGRRLSAAEPLALGEAHQYGIQLSAGKLIRVWALQQEVDLTLSLLGPTGDPLAFFDSLNGPDGPEWLLVVAEASGQHLLEINAIGGKGSYELVLEHLGEPRPEDEALLGALHTLGRPSGKGGTPELLVALQAIQQESGSTLPGLIQARIAFRLGSLRQDLGQLGPAVSDYRAAVEGFREFGNPWEEAMVLNHLGYLHTQLGQLDLAEETLLLALDSCARVGYDRAAVITWNNLGVLSSTRGDHSAALDAYGRARDLRIALGESEETALGLHNLGSELLHLGRLEEGVALLQRAAESRQAQGDQHGEGRAQTALAWGFSLLAQDPGRARGEVPLFRQEALESINRAIGLLEARRSSFDLAIAHEIRSQIFVDLGDLDSARRDLETSLHLADASAVDLLHGAWVKMRLGIVQREQGELEPALASLRAAAEALKTLGNRSGEVIAQVELARTERRAGRISAAAEAYEDALDAIERSRDRLHIHELRRSFLAGHQSVYEELIDLWAEASWQAARPGDDETAGDAETADEHPRAQSLAERAFRVVERSRARALLDQLSSQPATAASSVGTAAASDQHPLDRVVQALEVQYLLPGDDLGPGSPLGARPGDPSENTPGGDSPGARLGGGPRAEDSASPASERLRQARLQWQWSRESSQRREGRLPKSALPVEPEEIRGMLEADTALLAYSLGDERSWLFVLDQQGIRLFRLADRRHLESAARRAHELLPRLDSRGYRSAARDALEEVATLVLAPWLEAASSTGGKAAPPALPESLLVVPAGALHLIPFGLLSDQDGRALLLRHDLVHLPSASTWVHLRQRSRSRPAATGLLAIVADPIFDSSDTRLSRSAIAPRSSKPSGGSGTRGSVVGRRPSLRRLPDTLTEARQIADVARGLSEVDPPRIYQGAEANLDLVLGDQLRHHRILHFATHGLVDAADPSLASLVLSLRKADGRPRDGLLTADRIYGLRLDADLVVLSACRTALGQPIRGAGLVGLSHAFFAAGAHQLVVSLWDVDDAATAELMTRFYRALLEENLGPAQALRRAQMGLRNETRWTSPVYWGAFVVLGDGTAPLDLRPDLRPDLSRPPSDPPEAIGSKASRYPPDPPR